VLDDGVAALEKLPDAPERLERNINVLRADGVREPLNEHDIAAKLSMKPFYTRVYRPGSDTAHYSIGAALDGLGDLTHEQGIGPVSLERPDKEEADQVLILALIVYGPHRRLRLSPRPGSSSVR